MHFWVSTKTFNIFLQGRSTGNRFPFCFSLSSIFEGYFLGHSILGWWFFFFLACIVSEKSYVILTFFTSKIRWVFSFLSGYSDILWFENDMPICRFLVIYPAFVCVLWVSWIWCLILIWGIKLLFQIFLLCLSPFLLILVFPLHALNLSWWSCSPWILCLLFLVFVLFSVLEVSI